MSAVPELLRQTPLFGILDPDELVELAGEFREVSLRTGETVCREGDESDGLYVVLSGELAVWGGGERRRVINRLGPGEVLGEMSLIAGGRRTATVTVARSARLLVLDRAAFDRVLLPNPKVLEYFARLLSRRLATTSRGDAAARRTTVISVTAAPGLHGKSLIASALAGLLAHYAQRDAIVVEAAAGERDVPTLGALCASAPDRLASAVRSTGGPAARLPVAVAEGERPTANQLVDLAARLGDRFPFIVLDLAPGGRALASAGDEVADALVVLVDEPTGDGEEPPTSGARVLEVVNLHNRNSRVVPISRCAPFVVPHDPVLATVAPEGRARYVLDRPRSPAAPALARLARKILGATVGLAMGGGAAFGVAHVGVLKVLEDNDVPIDLIAGSSMGSIVAIGYAAGIGADEMIEIARRIGTKWTTLSAVLDFTFTRPGLLSGDRLARIFMPLAGEVRDFTQLRLPCRTVATDIETGERVEIAAGSLEVAFRASSAVPMLWAPVKRDGRVLVDGGVSDPVPAEVVTRMGADVCVAVNAVPRLKKGIDTVLSRLYRRLNAVNPLAYLAAAGGMPSTFDIVMNAMQTLQHELGHFKAISADVRINPDLQAHTWIEFYRPLELIERGAEAAERALPDIRRALARRLDAAAAR
jgi:NTE family protein